MPYVILFALCLFPFMAIGQEANDRKEFISQQALDLASSNNAFAFDLYNHLEPSGNLCFSPYSISSALVMCYNGAQNETKNEMSRVLRFKSTLDTLNESFSVLNRFFANASKENLSKENLSKENPDFRIDIVNSLWVQSGMQIVPQFIEALGKYFKAPLHPVDFLRQREIAREEINRFVKEKTMGRITNLVGPTDIDHSTKMVLVSSIYLKAKWKKPFEPQLTKMEPFFVDDGKTVSIPTMHVKGFYPYHQSKDFAAAEIGYIQPKEHLPKLAFLVLLPEKHLKLQELETKMNEEVFSDILSHLESEELNISLPKFTFTESFSLKNILTQMGMEKAFSPEAKQKDSTALRCEVKSFFCPLLDTRQYDTIFLSLFFRPTTSKYCS